MIEKIIPENFRARIRQAGSKPGPAVDTITTRFLMLFLFMLAVPLATVILFTTSLIEEHLSVNVRNELATSSLVFEGVLERHFESLGSAVAQGATLLEKGMPLSEVCQRRGAAVCFLVNRSLQDAVLADGRHLDSSAFQAQASGFLSALAQKSQADGAFLDGWGQQPFVFAVHRLVNPAGALLVMAEPLNETLVAEALRQNPFLENEIWILREPVGRRDPVFIKEQMLSSTPKAISQADLEIIQRLPDFPVAEARDLQVGTRKGKGDYQFVQSFLYSPDHRKLARVVHILPLSAQQDLMQQYYLGIYIISVASLLFSVILAMISGRTITQPLLRLIQQVNAFSRNTLMKGEVSVHGVHEINQLSQAFNRMLARLRQEQKIKDEFVATITHDLKVPLLAEKQTLAYFERGSYGPLSPTQAEVLEVMRSSNLSTLSLVNGMLEVYRYESGEVRLMPESFDVVALAEEITGELRSLSAEKRITVVVENTLTAYQLEEAASPGLVYADKLEIRRVLHNLVSNAIVNTPKEGSIRLLLVDQTSLGSETLFRLGSFEQSSLKAPLRLQERILISVQDSGIGFSADELGNLFQQFAANRGRNPMSIGLGLYNCHQVIQAHNSVLWVETTEGEGSAVNFLLPRNQEIALDRRRIAHDRRRQP